MEKKTQEMKKEEKKNTEQEKMVNVIVCVLWRNLIDFKCAWLVRKTNYSFSETKFRRKWKYSLDIRKDFLLSSNNFFHFYHSVVQIDWQLKKMRVGGSSKKFPELVLTHLHYQGYFFHIARKHLSWESRTIPSM